VYEIDMGEHTGGVVAYEWPIIGVIPAMVVTGVTETTGVALTKGRAAACEKRTLLGLQQQ